MTMSDSDKVVQLTAELERTFSPEEIRSAQEQMLIDLEATVKTLSMYTKIASDEGDLLRAGYFGATLVDMSYLLKTTREKVANDNSK